MVLPSAKALHSAASSDTPAAGAGTAVRADTSRLSEMLAGLADIGADANGGISRLCYTPAERAAHARACAWLTELGLTVRQDAAGNTLAERPGSNPSAPAIGIGSHLDSVPHGGRYDGTVGVVGAIEVARLLSEHGVVTEHPLRIVIFAAEEGARFGEPCLGSKAVVGAWEGRDLSRVRDAHGTSLADALASVGLDPAAISEARWHPNEWAAFLELHIEQGRLLETEGRAIGLVDTVSGSTRLRLSFLGRGEHSGGAPMGLRADALTAAADVVLAAETLANDPRHRGTRATVGRLDVYPNSITTIPARVTLVVDIRDVDSDRQRLSAAELVQRARQRCERRGVRLETEVIADTSPAVLPMWLREITGAVCRDLGIASRVMTSGPSHDAQIVNRVVPAAMLFVPSKDGLSHTPEEWTSVSDIARGVEVLYASVLRLDSFLARMRALDPAGEVEAEGNA